MQYYRPLTDTAEQPAPGEFHKIERNSKSFEMEMEKMKKNKGMAVAVAPSSPNSGEDSEEKEKVFSVSNIKLNYRNTFSKYDFVKVHISFYLLVFY